MTNSLVDPGVRCIRTSQRRVAASLGRGDAVARVTRTGWGSLSHFCQHSAVARAARRVERLRAPPGGRGAKPASGSVDARRGGGHPGYRGAGLAARPDAFGSRADWMGEQAMRPVGCRPEPMMTVAVRESVELVRPVSRRRLERVDMFWVVCCVGACVWAAVPLMLALVSGLLLG